MVDVARILWKFVVGVKDVLALLFLLVFFIALFAALSASPNPGSVRDGVLLLEFDGAVSEQPAAIDPLNALLSGAAPVREYRQRDIIRALEMAVEDERVKAVVLDLDSFLGGGQVSLAAIGEKLDAVKKADKPVYAYATAYVDDGYQLAAHASEIWVNPLGGVLLTGPGGSRLYYKGLLDKTGIEAHVYRVGTYKSAVEPYLRADQSPAAKEALKAVYDEYWESTLTAIAKARPKAKLKGMLNDPAGIVEGAKGDLAKLAVDSGLVDKTGDRIAFGKYLAEKYGEGEEEKTGSFASFNMAALLASARAPHDGDPIAVITAAGTIVDGEAGPGTAAGESVSKLIYDAVEDDDVKAIVLRVDSPGGSVLASEQIRLALEAAKAKKLPIVVSMANLAASGGYWISTPADVIFAEPGTITGSIGIFGVLPSADKALAKLGITADGVKTSPLAGEPDPIGGVSPEFDRVAQSVIEKGYADFLHRVGKARGKTSEEVDAIAQGRIWAGGSARQLGLVDRLGGIEEALAEAAKLAKLGKGDWHPKYFEPQIDFRAALLSGLVQTRYAQITPMDLFARASWKQQQARAMVWNDLSMLMSVRGAQAHCLECGGFSFRLPVQARSNTAMIEAAKLLVN
ncbi:MAG: signal peptide peptidase SppA [Sphingorhabdus sp.]